MQGLKRDMYMIIKCIRRNTPGHGTHYKNEMTISKLESRDGEFIG